MTFNKTFSTRCTWPSSPVDPAHILPTAGTWPLSSFLLSESCRNYFLISLSPPVCWPLLLPVHQLSVFSSFTLQLRLYDPSFQQLTNSWAPSCLPNPRPGWILRSASSVTGLWAFRYCWRERHSGTGEGHRKSVGRQDRAAAPPGFFGSLVFFLLPPRLHEIFATLCKPGWPLFTPGGWLYLQSHGTWEPSGWDSLRFLPSRVCTFLHLHLISLPFCSV